MLPYEVGLQGMLRSANKAAGVTREHRVTGSLPGPSLVLPLQMCGERALLQGPIIAHGAYISTVLFYTHFLFMSPRYMFSEGYRRVKHFRT